MVYRVQASCLLEVQETSKTRLRQRTLSLTAYPNAPIMAIFQDVSDTSALGGEAHILGGGAKP